MSESCGARELSVWGSSGLGEFWHVVVAMWGEGSGMGELRCRGVAVWGNFGAGEFWSG